MRKTTEELRKEAGIKLATAQSGTVGDYFWCEQKELETFRRLVIENERECTEPVAEVRYKQDGYTFVAFKGSDVPVGTKLFTFPPAAQVTEGWKDVAVELPKDGQLIVGCNKDYGTWTEVWDSEESVGATRWWIVAPEVKP